MSDLSLQAHWLPHPAGAQVAPDAPPSDAPPSDAVLATLLALARRCREAQDAAELGFIAVNETHALLPYRQAALWWRGRWGGEGPGVVALSGVVAPEANAPYLHWLQALMAVVEAAEPGGAAQPLPLSVDTLVARCAQARPSAQAQAETVARDWADWLPAAALAVPLGGGAPGDAGAPPRGWLLLAREEPFDAAEAGLLAEWAQLWSQAARLEGLRRGWRGLEAVKPSGWAGLALRRLLPLAVLAGVLALPVRLSVLAPAELVPLNPAVVRAPLDGVVGQVLVQPNQAVREGQPLFEFDRASLDSKLEVARRALGTVQAEYRQKSQRALFDAEAKGQLAVLQGQIDEKQTEVAYLATLSRRGTVPAPRAGVVLFGDASDWVGKPVVTGERVMVVADPQSVELEGWLAPADALPLPAGTPVTLYLHTDPLHPVHATLRSIGHEAVERPDGHPAYRVRATLAADALPPRVGLKGTARLEGETVPLAYWVLRRPLAAARAWAGL